MSTSVVKFGFVVGEISPTLFGRTDLNKYDMALAQSMNWFVDYRGGLSTRPGFIFDDFHKADNLPVRMWPFSFAPDLTNNYLMIFGDHYIRFMQDGELVLLAAQNITGITLGSTVVITIPAHGLVNGWWVKISGIVGTTQLNGQTYSVSNVTTNTFEIDLLPDVSPLVPINYSPYVSGGVVQAVYEIVSPYAGTDLAKLNFNQYRDLVRITSPNFTPYDLTRHGNLNWTITATQFGSSIAGPTITGGSHYGNTSGTGVTSNSNVTFAVTAILPDGTETFYGNLYQFAGIVDYAAVQGSVTIDFNPIAGVAQYYVYRSVIVSQVTVDEGTQLGYVGYSYGSSFSDPNIAPDFTRGPPANITPFGAGTITFVQVTNGGSGYTAYATSVSVTDPTGTGFNGQVVVSATGTISGVIVKCGGQGYTAPVFTFTGSGTGATVSATFNPLTGDYPSLSIIHQQRQIYAASLNFPVTLWGSQITRYNNFNITLQVTDKDAYQFALDTASVTPIVHLLSTRGGLLAFTAENIWLLNGGGSTAPITPTNALAEPQTYVGVNSTRPLFIESDVLYVDGKGFTVQLITFNYYTNVYSGDDKSVLANHLFGPGHNIIAWAYQESPYKVVWAVREDGIMLAFTILKGQEVFAWTQCSTAGKVLDVVVIRENFLDRVYVTVQRYINGRWCKYIEEMDLRQFVNVEDAVCLDACLQLVPNQPNANLTIFQTAGVYTAVADAAVFSTPTGVLRGGNGVFNITSYLSPTEVGLEMLIPPTNWIPQTANEMTLPIPPGSWSLDIPTTVFNGLWHLEGEMVSILGDGNVFPQQKVIDGSVTISHPVSRACIGLPYTCQAQTLPVNIANQGIEANRKRIVGVAIRFYESRGLTYGRTLETLYSVRERTTENYGQATNLINGVKYLMLDTNWEEDGQTYFVQSNPLPATLLSIVSDIEVGDEPN